MSRTSIEFASNLVPLIKNRTKTFTYRRGDKYDFLSDGDVINVHGVGGAVFGKLKIIQKSYSTFIELPIDRIGHETYPSKEEQRKIFNTYYGQVNDADKFIVLEFELMSDE